MLQYCTCTGCGVKTETVTVTFVNRKVLSTYVTQQYRYVRHLENLLSYGQKIAPPALIKRGPLV